MAKKSFYLLAFIMFLSMTGYGVILPALPYLADSLGLSSFQMGSLITGWALAQFVAVPFWGRLIDRLGRKPVLLFGLFGFGLAFLLLIFARTYTDLLFIRIIGAILSSGTQPAALALVIDGYGKKERGTAIAKMAAANALGFLCGPAVGGIFSPLGIKAPFIAAGLLSFVTIPLAFVFVNESHQKSLQKKMPSFKESLTIIIKPGYRGIFFITFGLAVSASSLFGMLGYFMIDRFDSSASETGIAFSTQSLTAVIIQMALMGYIFSKFSEKGIAKSGILIETIGFGLIAFSFSIWMIYLGCALIGVGQAVARPTLLSLLSKQESIGQGTIMGFQQSMDSLGRSVGPLLAGWIFFFHPSAPFLSSFAICLFLFVFLGVSTRKRNHRNIDAKESKDEYIVK